MWAFSFDWRDLSFKEALFGSLKHVLLIKGFFLVLIFLWLIMSINDNFSANIELSW